MLVATVTDAANQPVEADRQIIVYWNTFAMRVQTPRYGYAGGEAVTVEVFARGHDGEALAGKSVTVRFLSERWDQKGLF